MNLIDVILPGNYWWDDGNLERFCFVELATRLRQEFAEFFVAPVRIVQVCARSVGLSKDTISRGRAEPVGGTPGFLVPDIRPVAIRWLAHDVDIYAALPRIFLVQQSRINSALE